jgi:hypothetical protein
MDEKGKQRAAIVTLRRTISERFRPTGLPGAQCHSLATRQPKAYGRAALMLESVQEIEREYKKHNLGIAVRGADDDRRSGERWHG